ncbi:phospholipase A [Halomonas sp. 18H]|uniref:phospholipase A n=1 Tax=Halomonas almeriensis TaxID=308163 RepID=UPI00222FB2B0|nr:MULTISPECIES: phospholipase A [Halomonas]MCW4150996.1 phospholipase A [Halomonas sp. 18H]MDN3552872.1 phospholipase A [Halomonas almeriensis]
MKPSRFLVVSLMLAGLGQQTVAADPLSDAEREAIESRIQSLQDELGELRGRLRADDASESTPGAASTSTANAGDGTPAPDQAAPTEQMRPESAPQVADAATAQSEPLEASVVTRRLLEEESEQNPYAITTHRRNYLLPLSYTNSPNDEAFDSIDDEADANNIEMKFQFSAKFQLPDGLLPAGGDLYFAYTQQSWWQAYNTDASSPFRETNYEPELFADFENDWTFAGWTNINNRLAFNHQSNGRSGELSRSWNRVILTSTFINDDWGISLQPHWRVPESSDEDDNPDIDDYRGYGDITVARRFFDDQEASLMLRGNPGEGNMGAQFDYSWPLFGKVRGHVQYYTGYGDSLIDYDRNVHRLGIGFSLNPLFSSGAFGR